MFKVQSTFSGHMIARERTVQRVCNDGRVVTSYSNRERAFMEYKIPQRRIKWTEPSRVFFKKTNKTRAQKKEAVPIMKIVRGFTLVPRALIQDTKSSTGNNSSAGSASWKDSRVGKNANIGTMRK